MSHRAGGAVAPKRRWGRAGAGKPPVSHPSPPRRRGRMLAAPLFPGFFLGCRSVFSLPAAARPPAPRALLADGDTREHGVSASGDVSRGGGRQRSRKMRSYWRESSGGLRGW